LVIENDCTKLHNSPEQSDNSGLRIAFYVLIYKQYK